MYWVDQGGIFSTSRIDLRETVLDVPQQAVITKDNVTIDIDALLYIQITDPLKATYEIANLPIAVSQLAQTSLRNVIGEMDLDETLASRDTINTKLKLILDEATDKWGTKVNRVELKNILPPEDIQNAMEKQMQAERERRAQVLVAEGDKQARIQRSEGVRQEQINVSEGEKEARMRRAEGEAEAIKRVAEAKRIAIEEIKNSIGDPELATQFLIATNYLEEFGKFTQKEGDKVFIPYEASTSLGALGSIKELLNGK
jgi:regulator of protease activity HflC (stomatin/prohibitin superfamily)